MGPRSFPVTVSGQATVSSTVMHPVTTHVADAVKPPQIDAPPFAVTAATGVPLIGLLGDILDIAPPATAAPATAAAPQLAPGGIYPLNPDGIPIKNPAVLKQPGPMKPPPACVVAAEGC